MIITLLVVYTLINFWILYIELLELHFGTFHLIPGVVKIVAPPLISAGLRQAAGVVAILLVGMLI